MYFNVCFNVAAAGDDFTVAAPFTVVFPPSATLPTTPQCVDVTALPDTFLEGDHSFTVAISTISNDDLVAGTPSSIEVTIDDDEGMYVEIIHYSK